MQAASNPSPHSDTSDGNRSSAAPEAETIDPLTGFLTQSAFTKQLNRLIEQRQYRHRPMTLALLQLANFYEIVTWIGTEEARQLLRELAALLRKIVPPESSCCRCRNHEIAVLLTDDGSRNGLRIIEAIHGALQTRGRQRVPPQLQLTCGVGLAAIDAQTPDSEIAFARARHDIWRRHVQRLQWEQMLVKPDITESRLVEQCRSALRNNRLILSYQALISFREDCRQRYELRASLPGEAGPLPVAHCQDLLVKNALGEPLDRNILQCAIATLAARPDTPMQFTVTLSQNSLVSPAFTDWLADRVPAGMTDQLVLQISELDLFTTQHHLDRFARLARSLGLHLGISDFGVIDNPLRFLSLLPADVVKLHRTRVVKQAETPARKQELTTLTAALHEQGIRVVAPDVACITTLPVLWKCGVDLVQGDCVHPPSASPDCEFVEDIELTLT